VDEVFGALKGGEIFKNRREKNKSQNTDKKVMDSIMGTLTNIGNIPDTKDQGKKEDLVSLDDRRKQREARKKQQDESSLQEADEAEKKRLERRKRLDALRNS